ncbi:hypothetical protein [Burkholderia cepacia]|uniref:hypothetical protein n=1 Tax=Burkholderia cepacia TaxID=292 RepID=UPI000AF8E5BC|nr:hypothetical protein [Burkholderia cepacia]
MKNLWKVTIFATLTASVVIGYLTLRDQADAVVDNKLNATQRNENEASRDIKFNQTKTSNSTGITIPKEFQFVDATTPAKSENDEELRNSYGGTDRLIMDEFYKKFDQNIIAFKSKDQYDWLAKNGYPLPDDVIAGYKMSIEDLGRLVDEGNLKASYFYLMRNVYSVDSSVRLDRTNKGGIGGSWSKRYVAAEDAVMKSGSPFTGYMLAAREFSNGKAPESVYAGYALASIMGDPRALNAMSGSQEINMRAFVSILTSNINSVRSANSNAFAGKVREFPDRYSVGVAP